jgi:urease accessory protein
MLHIERRAKPEAQATDTLTLFYDERKKSRLRARTDGGVDVAMMLPRGSSLRDGDLLEAKTGEVIRVRAARELVSEATTGDALLFARAVYHLGNRHVPLQIAAGLLRYQRDHVLDQMLRELGLHVAEKSAQFEPEAGAYAHGHGHGNQEASAS